jgi:hypothetical protein
VSPVELALARRLAQHPRFRWMPGMRVWRPNGNGWHVTYVTPVELWSGDSYDPINGSHVPDLSDPATQGCLWAMLNEAARPVHVYDETDGFVIECHPGGDRERVTGRTIGEALACALMEAWHGPAATPGEP